MIEIAKDSPDNTATFLILDGDGVPKSGVAYNAAGLVIFYTPHGGTQVAITLSPENWHEKGNGWYEVDVPDAVYASVRVLDFGGVITDGHVIGERQSVVEDLYSEAGVHAAAAAAIRDYDPPTNAEFEARTLPGGVYLQYDVFLGFIQLMCRADSMADTDRLIWLQAINADEGAGAGTFDNTKESQQALRNDLLDAVDSLDTAGNGPCPCTWTIEYDAQPLQNAVVAFYLGTVLKGRGLTDADGRVAMSLAAGQYTVAIEAAGFAHVPEWYTVSAAETTWENTFNNLEPVGTVPESEDPARCTGYATVYDQRGVAESGAVICSRLVAEPDGSGVIGSDTVRQETSDAAAQVVFTGLWIGAQYRFWRHGSEKFHVLTITAADVDEQGRFALPNFYG